MQPGNAAGLHHPFQKVTAFHAKHLHVIQPADGRPGTNPPYAAQKPFYSQKTAFRIMGRHLEQEPSVPTPQINLKRTIRSKNIRRRQHLEKIVWNKGRIYHGNQRADKMRYKTDSVKREEPLPANMAGRGPEKRKK